jgi:hypothetical protein
MVRKEVYGDEEPFLYRWKKINEFYHWAKSLVKTHRTSGTVSKPFYPLLQMDLCSEFFL